MKGFKLHEGSKVAGSHRIAELSLTTVRACDEKPRLLMLVFNSASAVFKRKTQNKEREIMVADSITYVERCNLLTNLDLFGWS
jgi:hypothetical protein